MLPPNPSTLPRPILEDGRVYRLKELARVFDVSQRTLYRACEAHLFPKGRRIGRYRFWSGQVILDWLNGESEDSNEQVGEGGM